MSIALSVLKYSPADNPDRVWLKCTFLGNYVPGGDILNLNPSTWSDPLGIGILGFPDRLPTVNPSVYDINYTGASVGGYADVVPGATLATYKLQQFVPGGNVGVEMSAAAYPAGVLAGYVTIEVPF